MNIKQRWWNGEIEPQPRGDSHIKRRDAFRKLWGWIEFFHLLRCSKSKMAHFHSYFITINGLLRIPSTRKACESIVLNKVCATILKALANEDTLLPTQMFPRLPAGATFLWTQKMFLVLFRNILCPQQMFPSLRSPRNIMGNNVSATCVLVYQGLNGSNKAPRPHARTSHYVHSWVLGSNHELDRQ